MYCIKQKLALLEIVLFDLFLGALEANAYKHDFHKNTYFEFQTTNLQMKFCK